MPPRAHGNLADKNKLNAADAQAVENAFKAKLEALGVSGADASEAGESASAIASGLILLKETQRRGGDPDRLTRACWPCLNLAGCVTEITSNSWPSSPA